jgi:dihydroorotate dehydrogenase electron transfer subunit
MYQEQGVVISLEELWPAAYLIWVHAPQIAGSARPGQYVMLRCGEGHQLVLRRPLSVHRVSGNRTELAFIFSVVGAGTEWMARRSHGDALDLFGPLGNGFDIRPEARTLLLVAGGMGVAPLVFLAGEAVSRGFSATLLMGCATAAGAYPQSLLPSGLGLRITTEDCSLGEGGMATDVLPGSLPTADQVFACGPVAMYRSMAGMGKQFGERSVQVSVESVLGCGVGACLGCSVETRHGRKLVCKDGPVFELKDILWDKIVEPPRRKAPL